MIEVAIVSDDGGFADHDSHAVINNKTAPQFSGGVNLDAGQPAGDVRRKAPQ